MSTQLGIPPGPPKLLPAPTIPTSIVCDTCKEETGLTLEKIMEMSIDNHICCPICNAMMYSCLPERPGPYVYSFTPAGKSGQTTSNYDDDDYD